MLRDIPISQFSFNTSNEHQTDLKRLQSGRVGAIVRHYFNLLIFLLHEKFIRM